MKTNEIFIFLPPINNSVIIGASSFITEHILPNTIDVLWFFPLDCICQYLNKHHLYCLIIQLKSMDLFECWFWIFLT